jgi:hypothetical protein
MNKTFVILFLVLVSSKFSLCGEFICQIDSSWISTFYEEINEPLQKNNIYQLKDTTLTDSNAEIRIWFIHSNGDNTFEGYIIKNNNNKWSGYKVIKKYNWFLRPFSGIFREYFHSKIYLSYEVKDIMPHCGWDSLWTVLNNNEILTLPELGLTTTITEETVYIFEVNFGGKYRIYSYLDFEHNLCYKEVKKAKNIINILKNQFK